MPPSSISGVHGTGRAVALFQHTSTHWLRWFLKPGFRHCAVIVESGDYWVLLDPALGYLRVQVMAPITFNIAEWYEFQGITAAECTVRKGLLPLRVMNCVGFVKAVLGVNHPFVLTPYQLYRRLRA